MPRVKYNLRFPDDYSDFAIELHCFREWWGTENGGLGRYMHFKNAMSMAWPDRVWTQWDDLRARVFCDPDYWVKSGEQMYHCNANVGCAASGKSDFFACAGFLWWMADPMNSAMIITSITKANIKSRQWAMVQRCYHGLGENKFGNFIDSQMMFQAVKGDAKHSITALAVGAGETQKSVQRMAGLHVPRIFLMVDEAPGTPMGVFEILPNMRRGCAEFVFVVIGNAYSRLDMHGRICEPSRGWTSVSEDTEVWETRGIKDLSIEPGVCTHFHAKRSPNVRAKKTIHKFLFTYEDWLESKDKVDTLKYWEQTAGWWAPEGLARTVFDEATVEKCGGRARVTWESAPVPVAALDPAFGHDDCVLLVGAIGKPVNGPRCLEVQRKYSLKIKDADSKPVHYQVSHQVMELCKRHGVDPKNFAMDSTGNGGGVASVLRAEWSPAIVCVEFGGAPSERPVSAMDPRPCKEIYDRRVSELWFSARELLDGGQLKGLTDEMVRQFCARMYEDNTKKKKLETKADMKARIGRSPDDADACVVLVELARQKGLITTGIPMRGGTLSEQRMKVALEADELYHDDNDAPSSNEPAWMAWAQEED